MDPYDEGKAGIKLPDLKVDIVTFSFPQKELKTTDSIKVFSWPGEFEAADVRFSGIYSKHPKTGKETIIFKFSVDGIQLCHLGVLDHVPEAQVIDKLGKVDILLAPAGGDDTIGPKEVLEIAEDVEPSVIIPMMYSIAGLKKPSVDHAEFLSKLGLKDPEKVDRLDLKDVHFTPGSLKVIQLEPILG